MLAKAILKMSKAIDKMIKSEERQTYLLELIYNKVDK